MDKFLAKEEFNQLGYRTSTAPAQGCIGLGYDSKIVKFLSQEKDCDNIWFLAMFDFQL